MSPDAPKPPQFILGAEPPDFWWTVRVPVPVEDDYQHAELPILFAQLPQTELDKMRGVGMEEGDIPPTDEQIARRVVQGWRLRDPAGEPVVFSPQALTRLLAAPLVRSAIVATYLACMNGMAARKNA